MRAVLSFARMIVCSSATPCRENHFFFLKRDVVLVCLGRIQ